MDILSGILGASLSFSGIGDFDAFTELSVTACELSDGVWVCQTTNSQDPDIAEVTEQVEDSHLSDILGFDERQFLSEFFLPIADALSDELSETKVVPSQNDPIQAYGILEIPSNDGEIAVDSASLKLERGRYGSVLPDDADVGYYDDNAVYLGETDVGFNNEVNFGLLNDVVLRSYNADIYETDLANNGFYSDYEPVVMRLKPRLIKKWRQVPCHHHRQTSDTEFLFVNSSDLETLDEGTVCRVVAAVMLFVFTITLCCINRKICCPRHTSKEKNQLLIARKESGDVGNYKPPSFTMAVKRKSEKMEEEPHIIFI